MAANSRRETGNSAQDAAAQVLDRFSLHGKAAVVVGGTRGLGQAMALSVAGAGADVCVVGRRPANRLGKLEGLMGPVVFLASDPYASVNAHILPVDGGWLST